VRALNARITSQFLVLMMLVLRTPSYLTLCFRNILYTRVEFTYRVGRSSFCWKFVTDEDWDVSVWSGCECGGGLDDGIETENHVDWEQTSTLRTRGPEWFGTVPHSLKIYTT
jgi:hypothetical protein